MVKHVYVLGSNSFSGAHFVKQALDEGFQVTGISRSPDYPAVFLPYLNKNGNYPQNFTPLYADMNSDMDTILEACKKDKPQYVVNFAALGMVAESWQNPSHWFSTNTVAPLALYDVLRGQDNFEKFVQISTPEVYGSTEGLVEESLFYKPSTPYAVSKAAADMNLMAYHKAYGFPVAFTRAANVYGPCQQLYRIIPRCILYFLMGKNIELHGGGHSVRSFIHIKDVVQATTLIMSKAQSPEIFHISPLGHTQIAIKDLVKQVADQMGVDFGSHVKVVGERLGKDAAYCLDSTKLHKALAWRDQISLEQGIEELISFTRGHFEILSKLPTDYIHRA